MMWAVCCVVRMDFMSYPKVLKIPHNDFFFFSNSFAIFGVSHFKNWSLSH